MLQMFDALLPYYGNKRKLCPIIFKYLTKHISRDNWHKSSFYDVFSGSGAVSLYAKAQGFEVSANDSAKRSYIAGKALVENDNTLLTDDDIYKLFKSAEENKYLIEKNFSPDVFSKRHAQFLDNAFSNAKRDIDKYLLLKYIFHIRPYSKFTSPNAFNKPFEEGRFDDIKSTYTKHIKDNLKSPLTLLKQEKNRRDRIVHIDGYTTFFLRKYIKDVRPWLLRKGESDKLFITATGTDLGRSSFAAHFAKKYRPGIKEKFYKHVSPYAFRHSSATHWLDSGARKKKDVLAYIQRQLGHESLESTAIYTRVAIEPLRQMFKMYHPRDLQLKNLHKIPSPEELIKFWDKHKEDPPPERPFK